MPGNEGSLIFGWALFRLLQIVQVALAAQLHQRIEIFLVVEKTEDFDDVGMVQK